MLLRLVNDRLRRYPRRFELAETDVGLFVDGNTSDLIERYLYVFGTWEPSLSAFLRSELRPGDVFLDIGANVGYFTLLAARAVSNAGRVFAVEALPATAEKLQRNINANGLANAAVLANIASDEEGEVEMYRAPATNVGKSGTTRVPDGVSVGRVPMIVASDAVPRALWPRVRAIKVDVEGHELRVIRGLQPLMDQMRPGASVVVEVAPDRLAEGGGSSDEIFELMSSHRFSAASLDNDYHPRFYASPTPSDPKAIDRPPDDITDVVFTKRT